MFCFPITDHVMVPKRTVSFNCRLMHVHPHAYVCNIINEKTKGKFPKESIGLYWETKTYKLKRSIKVRLRHFL